MRRSVHRALCAGAVALTLLLASCGGDGAQPQAVGSGNPGASPGGTPGGTAGPTVAPLGGATPGAASTAPSTAWPSPSPGVNYLDPTSSPAPFSAPWTPEVPVSAEVTPSCVRPGGRANLSVRTEPKSGVAYHAMYAGSRGGATPPYGSGFGGNDQGFSDGEGRYSSSWIVSPEAPPGPARVDVIVAAQGDRWGYDDPPFWVADPSGRC